MLVWTAVKPLDRVGSGRRLATPHAKTRPSFRACASAGRHDDPEVRYIALTLLSPGLLEELQASRLRVVEAAERERRRFEQDLHDGAQQRLVEIQLRLRMARAQLDRGDLVRELDAIERIADAALDELRALARGIYPTTLRDLGLAAALRAFAQRSVVPIQVTDHGIPRSSAAIEAAIYFCAREAIQNSAKHAGQGARVSVTLRWRRGMVELTVRDDGIGISPEHASNGIGMLSMRDRIEAVGGAFKTASHHGLGTCIHASVPTAPRCHGTD